MQTHKIIKNLREVSEQHYYVAILHCHEKDIFVLIGLQLLPEEYASLMALSPVGCIVSVVFDIRTHIDLKALIMYMMDVVTTN